MLFNLKPLSREAIPSALAKAERYRLLGEPLQAESICRDILAVDAANQEAVITLLLALTEQFDQGIHMHEPIELLNRLTGEYEKAYYLGIIHERRALILFRHSDFRSGQAVHSLLLQAMDYYQQAESLRPSGNDDSLLRWNACARFLRRTPHLAATKPARDSVFSSE
jgi:hypothetical protein